MSTRRRFRVAVFATAAGLLGAACGGGSSDTAAEPQATIAQADPVETETAETAAPAVDDAVTGDVPSILQFTNALVGGGELDASTLADKPTVFWFWSPN